MNAGGPVQKSRTLLWRRFDGPPMAVLYPNSVFEGSLALQGYAGSKKDAKYRFFVSFFIMRLENSAAFTEVPYYSHSTLVPHIYVICKSGTGIQRTIRTGKDILTGSAGMIPLL